jgi:site-specific DNA-methyltransferase (adenine-specific)
MNTIQPHINQIITGDCINVMQTFPTASIDLIITDPPYLVGYRSRDGRPVPNDNTDVWLTPAFTEMYRVLKHNRFAVSFYGWRKADVFLAAWKHIGFRPVGHLVWSKDYHSNNQERFLRYSHESAYLLAKGEPAKPKIALRDVLEWRYTGDELHPTQKPVMAIIPLLMAFSNVRDIVLDPFAGSGTTAVAAQALGRRYIGIELDPKYARIAEERLHNEHVHEKIMR